MVVKELLHALPIPDPRPTKANPEERAKRKAHEKENPHFQMQEFGLKAGVLALMAVVAVYPWERKYDEHVAKSHPERLERGKEGDGRAKDKDQYRYGRERNEGEGRERERRRSADENRRRRGGPAYDHGESDGRRRERRRTTTAEGSGGRQRGYIEDRDHRGSVPPASHVESPRVKTYDEDPKATRRRSIDPVALRLAVADGYSYVSEDRAYIDGRRSADQDWERRPREFVQDQYAFRPRRIGSDRPER